MASRLQEKYNNQVAPAMMEKFGYKNIMEIPKLDKIVINMGVGNAKENPKGLEKAVEEMELIAGQKPVITKARKSIAAFKLREGANVGCKVTLRKDKMYDFAYKLFNVSLPRVRDFRGLPNNSFDGKGNYSLGIKEQVIKKIEGLRRGVLLSGGRGEAESDIEALADIVMKVGDIILYIKIQIIWVSETDLFHILENVVVITTTGM